MLGGEHDVGDALLLELARLGQRGRQEQVPLGGDRGEQAPLVAEVVGRRGVRDAGLAGHLAQAQCGRPVLGDQCQGRVEQGPPQRAVMVRARSGVAHAVQLTQILTLER
jgi:hypothetical protein